MKNITPFLWFNDNAEEAVNFYCSVFKKSDVKSTTRYSDGAPLPKGTVMTMSFQLNGQDFVALNGGPRFKFTEAISFLVECENQDEIDFYWNKLSDGGEPQMCGWLKDKFGLSWQIVPSNMDKLMNPGSSQKAAKVMEVLLKMKKIDMNELQRAGR